MFRRLLIMIETYAQQLNISLESISKQLATIEQYLSNNELPSPLLSYRIPELGEGGSCSLFGQLQETPFQLGEYIDTTKTEVVSKLAHLTLLSQYIEQNYQIDWFGIYQSRNIDGQTQLLKLAYYGAPSRPLFPVNEAFAQISNNASVALSNTARIINDVEEYVANGGEYYTCDPKVKSEACIPLFDKTGNNIGIIDAETFSVGSFDQNVLAMLAAVCILIPNYLPQ